MTLPTGSRLSAEWARRTGLTLLELILVLAILTILAAMAAPRFSGFVEGRKFDAEWERLMAQLRFARSEAVSRAVPVEVWFDAEEGAYGVVIRAWHGEDFTEVERLLPEAHRLSFADERGAEIAALGAVPGLITITFRPDGSLDDNSPEYIELADEVEVRVARRDPVLGYVRVEEAEWL